MFRFLSALALLSVGGFFLVQRYPEILPFRNCAKPINYSIGTFDTRFGISEAQFMSAIQKAEEIWEKALPDGRELFIHSEEKTQLSISLVYDERQAVTQELGVIEKEVERNEVGYRNLEKQYEDKKALHDQYEIVYERAVAEFEAENQAYEEKVNRWNSGPKTSKSEYEALQEGRKSLEEKLASLRELENQLNLLVREINLLIERLNNLARSLNLNVNEYNTLGASRGDTFAGGLYEGDYRNGTIQIFEFESMSELIDVLAHELGHALGLEHLEDPQSIMHYLNHGAGGVLSSKDIEALKEICGVE